MYPHVFANAVLLPENNRFFHQNRKKTPRIKMAKQAHFHIFQKNQKRMPRVVFG